MFNYRYVICIIVAVFCFLLVGGAYLFYFHDGLSFDQNDWGNFGAYFSGILMPILTAINIYVFIRLTIEIEDRSERKRQAELKTQKDIQLLKLQFAEIKKLNDALECAFSTQLKTEYGTPSNIEMASKCISDFHYNLGSLFKMEDNRRIKFILALNTIETEFAAMRSDGLISIYALPREKVHILSMLKNDLINALYAFTFGEQEVWPQETQDVLSGKTNLD